MESVEFTGDMLKEKEKSSEAFSSGPTSRWLSWFPASLPARLSESSRLGTGGWDKCSAGGIILSSCLQAAGLVSGYKTELHLADVLAPNSRFRLAHSSAWSSSL